MPATKNNTANVSAAKGVAGGYFFWAPIGTTAPTSLDAELDTAFLNLGFISEDGIVFSTETDSEDLNDMNGDTMDSSKSNHAETFAVTFAEIKADVQKVLYGLTNVTDTAGAMTVHVKGDDAPEGIMVGEFVLKNGRRWRRVIHRGQPTEFGDFTVAAGTLAAREVTMKVYKDETVGDYYTDYYESTETEE